MCHVGNLQQYVYFVGVAGLAECLFVFIAHIDIESCYTSVDDMVRSITRSSLGLHATLCSFLWIRINLILLRR